MSDSHRAFCRAEALDPDAFGALLHGDKAVSRLSRRFEAGEIGEGELETEVARALGGAVAAEGLIGPSSPRSSSMRRWSGPWALRAGGVRTVLITNSYGPSAYQRWDLDRLADARVISGLVGVAKPSRGIYELALAEAGSVPGKRCSSTTRRSTWRPRASSDCRRSSTSSARA